MHRLQRNDRGMTLIEILVVVGIMALLGILTIALVTGFTRTTTGQTRNAALWASMQDANTQLMRDVSDGHRITRAEPNRLTVELERDAKCQERDWVADTTAQTLEVTTTFYDGAECQGETDTRTHRFIGNNARGTNTTGTDPTLYVSPTTFTYFATAGGDPMTDPVDTDLVSRVEWDLQAQADPQYRIEKMHSAAAFSTKGRSSSGDGSHAHATAPLLCNSLRSGGPSCGTPPSAATGKVEGRDRPVIHWTDTSPDLTNGWVVFRLANPDGMSQDDPARTSYQAVATIADPTVRHWVDPNLPAGYTATYVVRANLTDGRVGPTSNTVVSGLRPAAPTVTATGRATTIQLTWTAAVGATGYDVFRDGQLIKSLGNVASFTDGPGERDWAAGTNAGYGHSHAYRVVATNIWENRLTRGTDTARVPLGASVTQAYTGGTRLASTARAAAGAFTAPLPPTFRAVPAYSASSPNVYNNTVSRTAWAPWTGEGPVSKDGMHRDGSWRGQHTPRGGTWADRWDLARGTATFTDTGRAPGGWTRYRARACNEHCGPWTTYSSADHEALQRPPTPSCSTSSVTTRSATVTINRPAIESPYTASTLTGGTGDPGGRGQITGTTWSVDRLRHDTNQSFTVQSRNASPANGGWSNPASCTTRTQLLDVTVPTLSATTRAVTASASPTRGSTRYLELRDTANNQLARANGTLSHTFDRLPHSTWRRVLASNSDGYNTVERMASISTEVLAIRFNSATSITTKSFSITTTPTNGSTRTISVAGQSRSGTSASFTNLRDGTAHRTTATNSDGYNQVTATIDVSLPLLVAPVPAAPSCSVAKSDTYAPAHLTATASGGSGTRQIRMAGGTWYTGQATYSNRGAGSYSFEARSWQTTSDGYNTSAPRYSGSSWCSLVLSNPPVPGTPNSSHLSSAYLYGDPGSGQPYGGIGGISVTIHNAVPHATMYEGYATTYASAGGTREHPVRRLNGTTGTLHLASCVYDPNGTVTNPRTYVRAGNAYGWSGWYMVSATRGGSLPCV